MTRTLAALALLLLTLPASGAPAPFPKTSRPADSRLEPSSLTGQWVMRWSGHPWIVTLGKDGSYTCETGSTRWIGSWGVREGCLWITESSRPEDADSWRSYQIRLCPKLLSGKIEFGSPGTEVSLKRQ